MDPSYESQFRVELRNAQVSLAAGLEGRARVCARRAASILLRDYLNQRNELNPKLNIMETIHYIQEKSENPELISLLSHFSEKVNEEYQLPSGTDLVASLFDLAQLLDISVDKKDLYMTDLRILVYGTDWCPDCQRAREVFKKLNVNYDWINTDSDQTGRTFVMSVNHGNCSVPTIVFPDGSILVEPSSMTLETKIRSLI